MIWAVVAIEAAAIVILTIAVLAIYSLLSRHQAQLAALSATTDRFVSNLTPGDRFSIDLDAELPPRLLVLLMSYSCASCVQLARDLIDVRLDWPLWIILAGSPGMAHQDLSFALQRNQTDPFPIPAHARVFRDPTKRRLRDLGVTATPTGMAIVNGYLVDQVIGPTARWFQELPRYRSRLGRAITSSVLASIREEAQTT